MVSGGRPLSPEILGQPTHIADFQPIFARSASAGTSSKKVQLTLIHQFGIGPSL